MDTIVTNFIDGASFVLKFLAPEPISPLFQVNGPLYGFNEDITFISFFLLCTFLLDIIFVKRFLTEKSRYFALHTFCNTVVCFAAFPDVLRVFTEDPRYIFTGPVGTMVANSAVVALHLYHMLGFKVTSADLFHHLTFVGILSGTGIPTKHNIGVSVNFGCFFLSGLPGGIDYILLVLMYEGIISKATEKAWFSNINAYLRGPSMVVYAYSWWTGYWAGFTHPPQFVWAIIVILHFYNGQYYSKQAIETSAIFFYKEAQRKKATAYSADSFLPSQLQHESKLPSSSSAVTHPSSTHIKQN